jgi:hypothetical protein
MCDAEWTLIHVIHENDPKRGTNVDEHSAPGHELGKPLCNAGDEQQRDNRRGGRTICEQRPYGVVQQPTEQQHCDADTQRHSP